MPDRKWMLDFILKAREHVRVAKVSLPKTGSVLDEYDSWSLTGYSQLPFLVAQQLVLEAVELLFKVLLQENPEDAAFGHRIDKGYDSLLSAHKAAVDTFLQEAIDLSATGDLPYDIVNVVSVQSHGPSGSQPASREDYAGGPAPFVRYMAKEWSATQSQYFGLKTDFSPGGKDVTTNARAVAGSLVFAEKLVDYCIREFHSEAIVAQGREGQADRIYTVTDRESGGKLMIEISEWPDRASAEAAAEQRHEETGGARIGTSYVESKEGVLNNILLTAGRHLGVRPSLIFARIARTGSTPS